MANIPNANDPYRPKLIDEDFSTPRRFDKELQADPELSEGPASGSRIAAYTLGIAILLGVVFYGLNNNNTTSTATSTTPATSDTAQKAPAPTNNIANSDTARPPLPPGVRDVTPRNNDAYGVTTGAAPARPQAPQSTPTGTEVDRSKGGPSN
ncbi:hypothetical protein [Tardiphaga sp.]|uniref:hypothetical protein n=1 Tax=Tardiphaga sp. TaxID=1926292 RepID=UPI0026296E2D|nr:hypothetical protein [Tardiphaga sp.]MDB5619570.1 hypothetical protein [Tardiphaga sp.]